MDQNRALQPYNLDLAQAWDNLIQRQTQDLLQADQQVIARANAELAANRQRIQETRVRAAQGLKIYVAELERQKRQVEDAK